MAWMLDTFAHEEMEYGWQHPVAISNWPTTDPLSHPDEANEQEDLVSVDPMHVAPTSSWKAGYSSSYHIYPAYPDFMRHEEKYQEYRTAEGNIDPYAGYLHELRAHHEGIPLLASEYGTSSARGMAHRGPLGRNQGMHTEEAQGRINAELLDDIHDVGPRRGLSSSPGRTSGSSSGLEHGEPGDPEHPPPDVVEPPDQRAELRCHRHRHRGELGKIRSSSTARLRTGRARTGGPDGLRDVSPAGWPTGCLAGSLVSRKAAMRTST